MSKLNTNLHLVDYAVFDLQINLPKLGLEKTWLKDIHKIEKTNSFQVIKIDQEENYYENFLTVNNFTDVIIVSMNCKSVACEA